MGYRPGAYCTVWQVQPYPNFTKVRVSISRKNRETGQYEQDFSGFVMMVSQANAKAQRLKERDRIKLGDIDVTTTFNKEQNKEYVNYKCFDFEMADDPGQQPGTTARVDANPVEGDVEEDVPF